MAAARSDTDEVKTRCNGHTYALDSGFEGTECVWKECDDAAAV